MADPVTTLETPPLRESRWRRIRPPVLLAAGILGASLLLHLRDPHSSGSWGFCPWLVLTGTDCPGCGGLRAVNDLTNGRVLAAASSNLLFVGSLPLIVFFWGRWVVDRWNGRRRLADAHRAAVCWGAWGVLAVVFSVLRNTPYGAWLAA